MTSELKYLSGFGNEFATEAITGALPVGRNSPQKVAYGLYAEQISGAAFTAPRSENRRSWMYRIRPGAMHGEFALIAHSRFHNRFDELPASPNQLRWSPLPIAEDAGDFIEGMVAICGNGSAASGSGIGIHMYAVRESMIDRYFYNADAETLVVPQLGRLRFITEMGLIEAGPLEIIVIPRGIRFRVVLLDAEARGYVAENFGRAFRLPDLGPIGSNGLANPRDFQTPVAAYEEREGKFELIAKFQGQLWSAKINHSPCDVVAWHGNHAPYKYDLRYFNTIGSISFDHPDPSIFTVLTSPTDTVGVANLDFVIFPPRILAMQNTFRPPWFHRNIASEFMGLIDGEYDAKADGFAPGGASLHNCMSGHGPDAATFEKASNADLSKPHYIENTMAFMFESALVFRPSKQAMDMPQLQKDYQQCWQELKKNFTPINRDS